jgi:pimeloyl-ACP methyl ester carboxylesterase
MKKVLCTILLVIFIIALGLGINYGIQEFKEPVPASELVDYGSFTKVGDLDIHVLAKGSGVPIILIHGFSSNIYTWRFNIDELAKEFTVYAMDLPGFGYSEKPDRGDFDYSISGYADFIESFMDAMGIRKAVLVGNSMGGGVALRTYLRHPDRVNKIVLVDSVGYPSVGGRFLVFWLMRYPVIGEALMSLNYRPVIESSMKDGVYYDNSFVTDDVIDSYFDVYKTENAKKTPLWVMRSLSGKPPFEEGEIATVKVPTLIIWGAEDNLLSPEGADLFARDIADSKAIVLPEAGHMPHEEKADVVNDLISGFVKYGN